MAEFEVNIPDDFLKELLNANSDDLCEEMLSEVAPIMEETMKKEIRRAIMHQDNSTGELIDSVKARKPKKGKNGAWIIFVGPSGYSKTHYYYSKNRKGIKTNRRYKVSNALKMILMEYGSSKQSSRPVLQKITSSCEEKVIKEMQKKYNEKVGD